jgi:pyrrolidone-carboxylate peptidase
MSVLVTGFGAFLGFSENPSGVLAEDLGGQVLEVSFAAVDEFMDGLGAFDAWLQIGLAAKARTMLYETVGRNFVSSVPDVRGMVAGPGVIDPMGPPALAATLWHGRSVECEDVLPSTDAGGYMCNYLLYRALRRWPERRIGFLHVPQCAAMPLERQRELVLQTWETVA